jgi:hypothetical protein
MNDSTKTKQEPSRKKTSTTAKVIIFVCVAGIVLASILALDLWLIAGKLTNEVADPAKIRKVADSIADIREPLPSRFQYLMCLDLGTLKEITVEDLETGASYILVQRERKYSKLSDEEYLRGSVARKETLGLDKFGVKSFTPSGHGYLQVAGQSMPYCIGEASMSKFKITQLMGLLTPENNRKIYIILMAQSEASRPLTVEDVQQFLLCIKKFR